MSDTSTNALMTVNEFRRWAKLGRTKTYQELGKGTLKAVKLGKRTLIRTESAVAWLDAQPGYGEA